MEATWTGAEKLVPLFVEAEKAMVARGNNAPPTSGAISPRSHTTYSSPFGPTAGIDPWLITPSAPQLGFAGSVMNVSSGWITVRDQSAPTERAAAMSAGELQAWDRDGKIDPQRLEQTRANAAAAVRRFAPRETHAGALARRS
jgi:hypothetical protein